MQTPEERSLKSWSIRDEHIRLRSPEEPPEKIFYLDSGIELEIEVEDLGPEKNLS